MENYVESTYDNINSDNAVNPGYSYQSQIDQEFAQINQQINDLNLQYENNMYSQQPDSLAVQSNENYYDHNTHQTQNQYTNEQQYERPLEEMQTTGNYYGSYQQMPINDSGANFSHAEVNT